MAQQLSVPPDYTSGRSRSKAWNYFTKFKLDDGTRIRGSCNYCGKIMVPITDRMIKHLLTSCPGIPFDVKLTLPVSDETLITGLNTPVGLGTTPVQINGGMGYADGSHLALGNGSSPDSEASTTIIISNPEVINTGLYAPVTNDKMQIIGIDSGTSCSGSVNNGASPSSVISNIQMGSGSVGPPGQSVKTETPSQSANATGLVSNPNLTGSRNQLSQLPVQQYSRTISTFPQRSLTPHQGLSMLPAPSRRQSHAGNRLAVFDYPPAAAAKTNEINKPVSHDELPRFRQLPTIEPSQMEAVKRKVPTSLEPNDTVAPKMACLPQRQINQKFVEEKLLKALIMGPECNKRPKSVPFAVVDSPYWTDLFSVLMEGSVNDGNSQSNSISSVEKLVTESLPNEYFVTKDLVERAVRNASSLCISIHVGQVENEPKSNKGCNDIVTNESVTNECDENVNDEISTEKQVTFIVIIYLHIPQPIAYRVNLVHVVSGNDGMQMRDGLENQLSTLLLELMQDLGPEKFVAYVTCCDGLAKSHRKHNHDTPAKFDGSIVNIVQKLQLQYPWFTSYPCFNCAMAQVSGLISGDNISSHESPTWNNFKRCFRTLLQQDECGSEKANSLQSDLEISEIPVALNTVLAACTPVKTIDEATATNDVLTRIVSSEQTCDGEIRALLQNDITATSKPLDSDDNLNIAYEQVAANESKVNTESASTERGLPHNLTTQPEAQPHVRCISSLPNVIEDTIISLTTNPFLCAVALLDPRNKQATTGKSVEISPQHPHGTRSQLNLSTNNECVDAVAATAEDEAVDESTIVKAPLSEEQVRCALNFLDSRVAEHPSFSGGANDEDRFCRELAQYRCRSGGDFSRPSVWRSVVRGSLEPSEWWAGLFVGSPLARVALILLSVPASGACKVMGHAPNHNGYNFNHNSKKSSVEIPCCKDSENDIVVDWIESRDIIGNKYWTREQACQLLYIRYNRFLLSVKDGTAAKQLSTN